MKIRKLSALLLVLCMIFSLSVAAFAAEADAHTVYDSAPEEAAGLLPKQSPPAQFPAVRSSGN